MSCRPSCSFMTTQRELDCRWSRSAFRDYTHGALQTSGLMMRLQTGAMWQAYRPESKPFEDLEFRRGQGVPRSLCVLDHPHREE